MKKILIVDDEELVLKTLSQALRREGMEVLTATHLEEAQYAVSHTEFDAVITDLALTRSNGKEGLELLSYITERSPKTRVIVLTGYGNTEVANECFERGGCFFLEKPFDLHLLKAVL